LLKNREEVFIGKATSTTKERKRGKYKSDEVESMDKVQMLGEAFQKIQAATGIHVRYPAAFPPRMLNTSLPRPYVITCSNVSLYSMCRRLAFRAHQFFWASQER
jgi:hypothetical protein